jgi:hypothetical protein
MIFCDTKLVGVIYNENVIVIWNAIVIWKLSFLLKWYKDVIENSPSLYVHMYFLDILYIHWKSYLFCIYWNKYNIDNIFLQPIFIATVASYLNRTFSITYVENNNHDRWDMQLTSYPCKCTSAFAILLVRYSVILNYDVLDRKWI